MDVRGRIVALVQKIVEVWKNLGWRTQTVLITFTFSAIPTLIVIAKSDYLLRVYEIDIMQTSTFVGSMFASWCASLIFFVVIGSVVTIISFANPENDSFEQRARILFHNKKGLHINYILGKLPKIIEHYTEEHESTIKIQEYDHDLNAFQIIDEDVTTVRSFLSDTVTEFESEVGYSKIFLPPDVRECAKLHYIKIGSETKYGFEQVNGAEMTKTIKTKIQKGEDLKISLRFTYWEKTGIENEYQPVRYTRSSVTKIINNTDVRFRVIINEKDALGVREEILEPNGDEISLPAHDVLPGSVALSYKIRTA